MTTSRPWPTAGLNRIHIGLESGSDLVLKLVQKGDRQENPHQGRQKSQGGRNGAVRIRDARPRGRDHSDIHAVETADALNQINPDFIRLRTLAIPNSTPLARALPGGAFPKMHGSGDGQGDPPFLETLGGITSIVRSDHILNLFQEVEGRLPEDKPRMVGVLRRFLEMPPGRQTLYQVGRRLGIFSCLADMGGPGGWPRLNGPAGNWVSHRTTWMRLIEEL